MSSIKIFNKDNSNCNAYSHLLVEKKQIIHNTLWKTTFVEGQRSIQAEYYETVPTMMIQVLLHYEVFNDRLFWKNKVQFYFDEENQIVPHLQRPFFCPVCFCIFVKNVLQLVKKNIDEDFTSYVQLITWCIILYNCAIKML